MSSLLGGSIGDRSLLSPEKDLAALKVLGREFAGWTRLEVVASLENAARSFSFEAAERWSGEVSPLRIRPGSDAEVFLGEDLVVSGYIDSLDVSYAGREHVVSVAGRSRTADLVDCAAVAGKSWRNTKIEAIAKDLAATYNVTVKAEVDTGDPIKRHKTQRGETVYDAIERMARLRALLVTDDPDGSLLLTRAGSFAETVAGVVVFSQTGTTDATTALVLGENILAGSAVFDVSERFSEYRVKGQLAGDDLNFGEVLQTDGESEDTDIERTRILLLDAEARADKARCKLRAAWEAATRYGKSLRLSYVVQGWRQGDGRLWEPNQLVTVVDDYAGIDGEFLAIEVAYRLDEGGSFTTIQLAPIEGYEPLAPHKPRPRKRRRAKKGCFDELKPGVNIAPAKAPETSS